MNEKTGGVSKPSPLDSWRRPCAMFQPSRTDPGLTRLLGAAGLRLLQPYDMEVGAGTFHPATFLRRHRPEPWSAAYVQPSRRPPMGRYGENPNRLQHYYQYQVVIKPSPLDLQDLYLGSLKESVSIHSSRYPLRRGQLGITTLALGDWLGSVAHAWKSPSSPISSRSAVWIATRHPAKLLRHRTHRHVPAGVESVFDLVWTDGPLGRVTYGDVFHQNEVECLLQL